MTSGTRHDLDPALTAYENHDVITVQASPLALRHAWSGRSLWARYRIDASWLSVYGLVNALIFWLRFRECPSDSCVAFAPAIAKGSAEGVLFNSVLTLLSVCHRVVDWLRYNVASSSVAQRPLEMHRTVHVLTGSVVVVLSLVHSVAWGCIVYWARTCDAVDWRRSMLSTHTATHVRDEPSLLRLLRSLPMWTGLAMLVSVLLLLPFSIGRVRRASFDVLEKVHRVVLPPFVGLLLFHGAAQWTSRLQAPLWLVPALAVYAAERRARFGQRTCATIVCCSISTSSISTMPATTTIRLFVTKTERFQRCFEPGMFVYLKAPAIASLEWHPFSVCSSQDDALVELRIRVVGDWTRQLCSHLEATVPTCGSDHALVPVAIPVRVDGPFGTPTIRYHTYERVLLVALGVGVSPFLSILRHQLHTWRRQLRLPGTTADCLSPRLALVWVVRDAALVDWLVETLVEFDDVVGRMGRNHLHIHVVVTAPGRATPSLTHVRVHCKPGQRPHWPDVVSKWMAADETAERRAIFVSGSAVATSAIKHAVARQPTTSARQRVDVFAERFH